MSRRKLHQAWSDLVGEMREAAGPVADETHTLDGTDEMIMLDTALDIADKYLTWVALGSVDRLRAALPWSRPCYDKPHRCPGWVGGGFTSAMVKRCPEGGSLAPTDYRRRYWLGARCPECNLYVLPIVTQLVDPTYLWWRIRHPRWPYWASVRYWRRTFRKK